MSDEEATMTTAPAAGFTRYLRPQEMEAELQALVAAHPGYATLESIGSSFEGRPLWVMTLTDRTTGAPETKPAIYIDGNHHAGEVTGAMVCLYTIWHLLTGRADDAALAELLARYTFYIRPIVSPDGVEFYLTTPYTLRSTPRAHPTTERSPGLYPEDIDGDGAIAQMRIADPSGEWRASAQDPRLLIRRREDESGGSYYRLYTEGLVTHDPATGPLNPRTITNAPAYWGLDFNRSYPHNWQPEHRQSGAGPYPLYPPETRDGVDFVLAHPNIALIVNYHTHGAFCYVLPSSRSLGDYPHDDLVGDYRTLSQGFTTLTGQLLHQSFHEPTKTARFGSMMDWGYNQLGIYGWVPELWNMAEAAGIRRGDGDPVHPTAAQDEADGVKLLAWNDRELGGRGFTPWRAFDHPQLGPVEIGGWTYKFTMQNAPPAYLREICERHAPWTFYLARTMPRLIIAETRIELIAGEPGLRRIVARVANDGFLPTNISEQAIVTQIARPVEVTLRLSDGAIVAGPERQTIGHLPGRSVRVTPSWQAPSPTNGSREVVWVVRLTAADARATVVAASLRAGVARATIESLLSD